MGRSSCTSVTTSISPSMQYMLSSTDGASALYSRTMRRSTFHVLRESGAEPPSSNPCVLSRAICWLTHRNFGTCPRECFASNRVLFELLSDEEIANLNFEEDGKSRFQSFYNTVKTRKKCQRCSMPQPSYARLSLSVKYDWPADVASEIDFKSGRRRKPSA